MVKFNCKCKYCLNEGIDNHSYIWHVEDRGVWIEIPKNASGSLKNSTTKSRVKISEKEIENYNNGFIVLREPLDRFKSLLSHYFLDVSSYRFTFGNQWLDTVGISEVTNATICDVVLNNFAKLEFISEPHHFNSQVSFIPNSFYDLRVIKYYSMNSISAITALHNNVSNSNVVVVTKENENIIRSLYEEDFDLHSKEIIK